MKGEGIELMESKREEKIREVIIEVEKDDRIIEWIKLGMDKVEKKGEIVKIIIERFKKKLGKGIGSGGRIGEIDEKGRMKKMLSKIGDLRRNGGREKKSMEGKGDKIEDKLDVRDEKNIENKVGLINEENIEEGKKKIEELKMIENKERSWDEKIREEIKIEIMIIKR